MDTHRWRNLYFMLLLVVVLGIGVVGPTLYKHTRYSRFDMVVQGNPTVVYVPLSQGQPEPIYPTESTDITTTYDSLKTYSPELFHPSWEDAYTYRVAGKDGVWFKLQPQLNGNIELQSATEGTPLNDVGLTILNRQGKSVQILIPNHWYRVRQYGEWLTVKFRWTY